MPLSAKTAPLLNTSRVEWIRYVKSARIENVVVLTFDDIWGTSLTNTTVKPYVNEYGFDDYDDYGWRGCGLDCSFNFSGYVDLAGFEGIVDLNSTNIFCDYTELHGPEVGYFQPRPSAYQPYWADFNDRLRDSSVASATLPHSSPTAADSPLNLVHATTVAATFTAIPSSAKKSQDFTAVVGSLTTVTAMTLINPGQRTGEARLTSLRSYKSPLEINATLFETYGQWRSHERLNEEVFGDLEKLIERLAELQAGLVSSKTSPLSAPTQSFLAKTTEVGPPTTIVDKDAPPWFSHPGYPNNVERAEIIALPTPPDQLNRFIDVVSAQIANVINGLYNPDEQEWSLKWIGKFKSYDTLQSNPFVDVFTGPLK